MVTTEGDQDGLRMTKLIKIPISSRCVIRDVAPLTLSLTVSTVKTCISYDTNTKCFSLGLNSDV